MVKLTKGQILAARKYREQRDVLDALLEERAVYSAEEIEELLKIELKREVL